MKLQKLLFYAHAWYLGMKNAPLFEDDFEAWPHGPVVRSVYGQTRKFGWSPITSRIVDIDFSAGTIKTTTPDGVDTDELKKFIKEIWEIHKGFTGIQLSNSTHANGEPWTVVKEHYGSLDGKPPIPNQLIASIYKAKIANGNSPAA
jgi:uncharacterized phage-associated protein